MKKLLNTEEMAEILGVTYESLKAICKRDSGLPRIKISKKVLRFNPEKVISYFEKKEDKNGND